METALEKESQLQNFTPNPASAPLCKDAPTRPPLARGYTHYFTQTRVYSGTGSLQENHYDSYMADWGLIPSF